MNIRSLGAGFVFGAILFSCLSIAIAWTGPASAPPNGNVSAPINTGTTDQVKSAGLSVDALAVFGNSILSGVSRYLNFGTTTGSNGYGIRDNAGTLEFKSMNGSWGSLPTIIAAQGGVPVASIVYSAAASPDSGWLLCDGSAVSRTTYAALFAKIGTTYGAGNGVTTFNLPDLRGEFIRVLDNGRGIDAGRAIGTFQEGTGVYAGVNSNQIFIAEPQNEDGTYQVNTRRTWSSNGVSNTTNYDFSRTRPRNVALNAFIKY